MRGRDNKEEIKRERDWDRQGETGSDRKREGEIEKDRDEQV